MANDVVAQIRGVRRQGGLFWGTLFVCGDLSHLFQGLLFVERNGLRPGRAVCHGRHIMPHRHDRGHKIGGAVDKTHGADDPPRGQHMGHPVLVRRMDMNRGIDIACI